MVDVSRYTNVDEESGAVRVLWATLVSSLTGIIAWANIQGYISLLDTILGGFSSTISNVGTWGQNVVTQILTIPQDGLRVAFEANAEWLSQFGEMAQILAAVEVVIFVVIIYWTVRKALGVLF